MTPDKDSSEHLLTNGTNHDQPRKEKVSIAERTENPRGESSQIYTIKCGEQIWTGILTKYPHNSMIILSRHTILLFIAIFSQHLSLLSSASSVCLVRRGPVLWPTSSPWARCSWYLPPCPSLSCLWSRWSR